MRKYIPIIFIFVIVKLVIQLFGNRNYGFHRDELLHLSVSEHLDWGFMEFPPFIGLIGKLSYWLFDYHILGVRFFPTLAGIGILILCCLMAKELGGKSKAIFLSGICVLAFLPFYRNHTLFQPVAFDQFFWTLGFYGLIKFFNSKNKKFLLLVGIALGLGLMNKYTMIIWAFGVFIGLFFHESGRIFKNKWLYFSGFLALLIFLPNIIWQVQHDFPFLTHLTILNQNQLNELDPLDFGIQQLNFPFTLTVSLIGLAAFLFDKKLKKYRAIAVTTLVIFGVMWLLKSKAYYVFAIYPVLFAGGSVMIESLLSKKPVLVYIIATIILLPILSYIPYLTPILPIENFVSYADLQEKNGRIELTGDYADMFGWEEQVQLVDSLYRTLNLEEQKTCVLWAENYGEAGALKILGKKYGLPNPISRHGSFWQWSFGNKNAAVWISLGNEKPSVEHVFEEVILIKRIRHKYAIGEENDIPLFLCRKSKIDIEQWWKDYEEHIFD